MVQWVYERALLSVADQVVIATDDDRIEAAAQNFGAKVVMTSTEHASGTDRLAEVADVLGLSGADVVVNVQGDEPLIPPEVINQVAENLLANPACAAATLSHPIKNTAEFNDPSAVKVVCDSAGHALYFSRSPIPWPRDLNMDTDQLPESFIPQRHLGIYAYRVELLKQFVSWSKAPLEQLESLEQLRILHNGQQIHVQESLVPVPAGVDTAEDLERIKTVVAP